MKQINQKLTFPYIVTDNHQYVSCFCLSIQSGLIL